jgi:hypothetical protein
MSEPIDPDVPELRGLPGETTPPAALERRVVAALHREGLLSTSHRRARRIRHLWAPAGALAALLLLAAGWWLGARQAAVTGGGGMEAADYVFLLREDENYRTAPAGQEMDRVAEYAEWARVKGEAGLVVGGMKLGDESAVLAEPGHIRDATPGARLPGGVAGLFLVRSRSLAEARRLAETCPHLAHGGIIEVRPIEGS